MKPNAAPCVTQKLLYGLLPPNPLPLLGMSPYTIFCVTRCATFGQLLWQFFLAVVTRAPLLTCSISTSSWNNGSRLITLSVCTFVVCPLSRLRQNFHLRTYQNCVIIIEHFAVHKGISQGVVGVSGVAVRLDGGDTSLLRGVLGDGVPATFLISAYRRREYSRQSRMCNLVANRIY